MKVGTSRAACLQSHLYELFIFCADAQITKHSICLFYSIGAETPEPSVSDLVVR